MFKSLFFIFLTFLINKTYSFAINVSMPGGTSTQDVAGGGRETIRSDDGFFLSLLDVINTYLWFFLGVVGMGVVMYGGYLLVTSRGDDEQYKKANKILIYGVAGIIVALSSYALIRLVVNLL
ncbi:hypothetical protein [Candidatus Absconditicoccus praedator]|uniref:hypothetical protein n=1 Tax=Candidatus Absconditicoccus praedator TaxID=2735562 RepID=UPI001E4BD8D0|nr:hypothetical protein [Candidatus Absconditicoccus praedator]UFX82540.1 hypothetical protein HLG78_00100 [Candidatus Absconditicoccus praedator]